MKCFEFVFVFVKQKKYKVNSQPFNNAPFPLVNSGGLVVAPAKLVRSYQLVYILCYAKNKNIIILSSIIYLSK
jgi:hypothetical protein